jgi:hypothetical protein
MQNQLQYGYPVYINASNLQLAIDTNENIVLDGVISAGCHNFAVSINNSANSSNTVATVKIYGSNDGFNYYSINSSAITSISAGSTANFNFTATAIYIRITATATTTATVDAFLVGSP